MTVLVIEDDDDIRQVLRLSLAHLARCRVVEASGGADGVLAAAQSRPDLIMLDVMMPGTDGLTVCSNLRAHPLRGQHLRGQRPREVAAPGRAMG